MAIVLFDTNILIDHFAGHMAATLELANYDDAIISSLSWIEVACKLSLSQQVEFDTLLADAGVKIVHIDDAIMVRAAAIRRQSLAGPPKVALPDCIIRATAEVAGRTIVTRNPGDFGGIGPMVRVPYEIVDGAVVNIVPAPR
jgi:predicted nucleic acid-binding protein